MSKRKIIFTDFFGTLASNAIKYNKPQSKTEYQILQQFLKQYLNRNHLMYIISYSHNHATIDEYINIYKNLIAGIGELQKESLFFYINGNTSRDKTIIFDNFNLMEKNKEEALMQIAEDIKLNATDQIISAGDDINDLEMLFKANELGGISYFLTSSFEWNLEKEDEYLIRNIASARAISSCKGKSSYENSEFLAKFWIPIYNELKLKYEEEKISRIELEQMRIHLAILEGWNWYHIGEKKKQISEEMLGQKLVLVKNKNELYNILYDFNNK